ncbi:MAG: redoxin domain-containing protein [Pirellula sp.]
MHNLNRLIVGLLSMLACLHSAAANAADSTSVPVVPQTLLKLIHAPEVQQELGMDPDNEALLAVLRELDGPWWRSRNLPEDKQQQAVAELEKELLSRLKGMLSADAFRRLREIEVQSQGVRALVRPNIAKAIGLQSNQKQSLEASCLETDRIARLLLGNPKNRGSVEQELSRARETEQKLLNESLTSTQRSALAKLVGKPFDTAGLKRILPLAPELIDSGEWTDGRPTTLADHRGKVVLVHFYAFQCHNCVANFDHYNRWQKELARRGVSVIGIQTPETAAERNVSLVRAAAKEKGFEFPVLIDTSSKNWEAWGNTMWPTVYVVDKRGYIRSWWQGELNWQGATGDRSIETLVDQLLAE